jgi:hypothetical protein
MPQDTKVQAQPLVAVGDVRASSRWYQELLGLDALEEHIHRDLYNRLFCDGRMVLQLHAWDEHDHPNLDNPDASPVGLGVLLWFEVDDFLAAVKRARALKAEIVQEAAVNPNSQQPEIWLHDPDGYVVVVAGHEGESSS